MQGTAATSSVQRSGENKSLIFSRVWPLGMHAFYMLSADTLGDVQGFTEVAQVVSRQNVQSMNAKISDSQLVTPSESIAGGRGKIGVD